MLCLARYMCAVCRDAEGDYRSLERVIWVRRYGSELPSVRASLEWAFGDPGDSQLGAETAAYSWPMWMETTLIEGQTWLARAEARTNEQTNPAIQALLWFARGQLLPNVGIPEGLEYFRRAVSAFSDLHDERRLGEAQLELGKALSLTGRPAEGYPILLEARSLIEKTGTPLSLAICLQSLAVSLQISGQYAESRSFYNAALELSRTIGDRQLTATVLANLGDLIYNMGDIDGAIACTAAAAEQLRRSGGGGNQLAVMLANLTVFRIARGEIEAACRTAGEALPLLMSAGMAFWFFDHLAALAAHVGDCSSAARLLGYSDATYARQNDYRQPTEQKAYEIASKIVRERIDDARLQELSLVGRSWTADQAFSEAKEFLQHARSRSDGGRS